MFLFIFTLNHRTHTTCSMYICIYIVCLCMCAHMHWYTGKSLKRYSASVCLQHWPMWDALGRRRELLLHNTLSFQPFAACTSLLCKASVCFSLSGYHVMSVSWAFLIIPGTNLNQDQLQHPLAGSDKVQLYQDLTYFCLFNPVSELHLILASDSFCGRWIKYFIPIHYFHKLFKWFETTEPASNSPASMVYPPGFFCCWAVHLYARPFPLVSWVLNFPEKLLVVRSLRVESVSSSCFSCGHLKRPTLTFCLGLRCFFFLWSSLK